VKYFCKHIAYGLGLTIISAISAVAQTPLINLADTADISEPFVRPDPNPAQDYCITVMGGFPNDDMVARYQFFRLTEEIALDATPEFTAALDAYGDGSADERTPVLEVIENIANPVIRQAAPEIIVASMDHLVEFAQRCKPFIDGQVSSLSAYDASLKNSDPVIKEDALFLRQILFDSLSRLGADQDPIHGTAVQDYSRALIVTRDSIEFEAYAASIDDIEAIYMIDLDGRLARSNDMINREMDREILDDAVSLADDMNADLKRKDKENSIRTLFRILGQY